MSTQLKVVPFYCSTSKSSCFKLQISYPNIPSLSYNFSMRLQVSLQKLLPRISYELVHEQEFLLPKKQIIVQHLQPQKMYQIIISWFKKAIPETDNIHEQKTVFACSQKLPNQEDDEPNPDLTDELYDQFVKGNIKGYFDEYYHNEQPKSQKSNASSVKNSSLASHQQRGISNSKKSKPCDKTPLCNSQSLIKAIGESDPFINKKNLQKYILEGRKSSSVGDYLTTKDFQCFDSCNKIYKNQKERRKHVEKTLLVSKAMNMFSEIYSFDRQHGVLNDSTGFENKKQTKGRQFFKNDWFMGPFYSYDGNERQMKKKRQVEEG